MIQQGADALSRGVWVSPLQESMPQHVVTSSIFAPCPYDPSLVSRLVLEHDLGPAWEGCRWDRPITAAVCLHRLTVWFPPPEIARQVICACLQLWVEAPLTTSFLFVIPRILLDSWRGVSKHLQELEIIYPHTTVMRLPPVLPIPIVVLCLRPFQRQLTDPEIHRLDPVPPHPKLRWHQQQAEHVRRLSPLSLPPAP